MHQVNKFITRDELDRSLAATVSNILEEAIKDKGKASIAVSGGSTPKGFFKLLSESTLDWSKVTITLADERWVSFDSNDSNTRLVHENLLQNNAKSAKFFHLKYGKSIDETTLNDLNVAAKSALLPLDVLILGMGEDGHTASLFPCSDEITLGLDKSNNDAIMSVQPKTAPHQRITFTFSALAKSKNTFLHICGENKAKVLDKAIAETEVFTMPIRAFLHNEYINTQVYWSE